MIDIDIVLPPHSQRADGSIVLATNYLHHSYPDDDLKAIAEIILSRYDNSSDIYYNVVAEGLPYGILYPLDKLTRLLIANGVDSNNITLWSGAMECKENHDFYLKHCSRFDFIPLKVEFFNSYETHAQAFIPALRGIKRQPELKPKQFLCFNRTPKLHRVAFVAELMRLGITDNSYVSMYINGTDMDGCPTGHFTVPYETFPIQLPNCGYISDYLKENDDKFPLRLTCQPDHNNQHDIRDDIYLFNESHVGIITETKYFKDSDDMELVRKDLSLDCFLYSEKTYKFILGKQPFIFVGFALSLAKLREQGYKTFHPYINESYDEIEDDEERLLMVVREVERLSKFSDDEWLEFQHNINSIVQYNFSWLGRRQTKLMSIWDSRLEHPSIIDMANMDQSNISEVIIDQLIEIQCNQIYGDNQGIAKIVDAYAEHNVPVTILTASTRFNPDLVNWDTSKAKIIEYSEFWFNITNQYMIDYYSRFDAPPPEVRPDYDLEYLYITMHRVIKPHRVMLMDMLANNNLIDNGAIAWRGVPLNGGEISEEEMRKLFRYWDSKKLSLDVPFDGESILNPYKMPDEYMKSFMQIVAESDDELFFVSEKTAMPLLTGKLFLVVSCKNYHKYLTEMGFELYDEIFDYSFDSLYNPIDRCNGIIQNIARLKDKSMLELKEIVQSVKDKLERNKQLALRYANTVPGELLDISKVVCANETYPTRLGILIDKERV